MTHPPMPRDHAALLLPASEADRRLDGLRGVLASAGLDAAWLTHGADIEYFIGTRQAGLLIVRTEGDATFFARKTFERAKNESPIGDVRPYDSKELRSFVISLASRRAAVVGACLDVLPASAYAQLIREIGETPADISMEVRRLRALKSPWEIERIRRAAEQVEPIFAGMADLVEPGMPEIDLSARIESRLRVAGHSGLVRVRRAGQEFPILALASGPAASYPSNMDGPIGFEGPFPTACAGAGWRRIQAGETFMADIVTQDAGYHADNARTFAVGSASEATLAAHAFCREALAEVVQRVRPGAVPSAIYEEVRAWAEARGEPEGFMGFGENRVRFFGHGVGLELDELPVIAPRFDDPLAEGMVIAIEPKAFSPTHGPAGLENTYIVTSSGAESLCRAPDEIVVL